MLQGMIIQQEYRERWDLHKEIELFGYKLQLHRRKLFTIIEVVKLLEDSQDVKKKILADAYTLENSLKPNIDNLRWWEFRKRINYKKKLNSIYLMKHLDLIQMSELIDKINELEGVTKKDVEDELKKKA